MKSSMELIDVVPLAPFACPLAAIFEMRKYK